MAFRKHRALFIFLPFDQYLITYKYMQRIFLIGRLTAGEGGGASHRSLSLGLAVAERAEEGELK